jgi:hypothetical protein
MTNSVEELLRAGIDRLTADVSVPAGLVRRAGQRNRRRRIAMRATAAAGTAVVAAVAVIAVTGGPQPARHAPAEETVAYVTGRTQHALAVVAQSKAIEEFRSAAQNSVFDFTVFSMRASEQQDPTGSAVLPGVLRDVAAQRMVSWYYRGLMLDQGFSATGALVFSSSLGTVTSPAGKPVFEAYGAAYTARIRWRTPIPGPSTPAPRLTCGTFYPGPGSPDLRAAFAKALSCRLLVLDGHQQVDGVNAIKLVLKPQPGIPLRGTFWVDPRTYLPLRTSTSFLGGAHGQVSVLVRDYQWLPPTRANLAALHAAIRHATLPAGFRKLPPADLPLVGFATSQFPGGAGPSGSR